MDDFGFVGDKLEDDWIFWEGLNPKPTGFWIFVRGKIGIRFFGRGKRRRRQKREKISGTSPDAAINTELS